MKNQFKWVIQLLLEKNLPQAFLKYIVLKLNLFSRNQPTPSSTRRGISTRSWWSESGRRTGGCAGAVTWTRLTMAGGRVTESPHISGQGSENRMASLSTKQLLSQNNFVYLPYWKDGISNLNEIYIAFGFPYKRKEKISW